MHSSTAWKDFKVKIISNAEVTWKIHTVYISKIHKKLNEIYHWKFSNKQLLLCNKICFFSWTKTMRKWNFRLYNCLPFRWRIFLTATWESHGQLWAILERTTSLNRCLSLCFLQFWPECHRDPRTDVGCLSRSERLVRFEPGIFRF